MHEAICTLEQGGWELHHYGPAGRFSYLVIASVTDQSCQS
jgi:hypothetical protein